MTTGGNLTAVCTRVVVEIKRLLSGRRGPVVVALDGGSGAGKSTLASLIEGQVDTSTIPLDDFFAADIPDPQWDTFSVEEKLEQVFDWRRLREDVLVPLLAGKPARWYAFDFESGLRADGTYGMKTEPTERAPAAVIAIEGAYSAGPALADVIDLAILLDVPVEERHARLEAREEGEFLRKWHGRWDPVEAYYFSVVRPKDSFDLVVRPQ